VTRQMVVTPGRVGAVRFEDYLSDARHRLFRFAVVLCGDPVLAEDIVTDVLGRAYERWHQVGAADNVHAYVRRMVVNEYLSWRRRTARTAPHADVIELVDRGGASPDHGGHHAERDALMGELSRLPKQQRAAIVLRFYEGLSDDEIAGVLDCRPGTVRSSVSRGLATLRIVLTTPSTEEA
jgi:RNA polymerase sigma-70 factor (sigma-E family)